MEVIINKIKIVPLKKVLIHENIVKSWAHDIATYIEDAGIQKNPIIVHKIKSYYIVLDGMHRVDAFKQLNYRDIMVYEVNYFSEEVKLGGWDAIIINKEANIELLNQSMKKKAYNIIKINKNRNIRELIQSKEILFGVRDKKNNLYGVQLKNKNLKKFSREKYLDEVITALERFEFFIDDQKMRILYVPDTTSDKDFKTLKSTLLIYRPIFTKEDIIYRTLSGKIFPRKSTRHLIPGRPLRVDINLTILKENISLKIKNKLLRSHLLWCFKSNRVRYYPESVYVFSD